MAEKQPEDKCQQTAEPDKQKSDPPVRPARRQSVVIYLIILFLAAFLLLLMAYFMQQRNSNAIIGNLQDSLSSFQTMEELREENAALQQELQGLKEENAALQEENETLGQQYADASQQAGQAQAQADLRSALYVAEYLYRNRNYQEAAERLVGLSEADLSLLSGESDSGAPSDRDRYETLKANLMDLGYVEEGSGQPLQLADPSA